MNSRLNVLVGAKIQGLEKGLKKAQRSMRKFSRSTEKLGRSFTRSLTLPLAGFAAMSIKAFDTQAKAEAALNTALADNEQAFKSLTEQAKELQKITLFGDEETIAAQTMLATMGLEEEAIKRLIPLVQDMATAKGMNLTAAADLVAKSVGSSTNALSRYGITIEGAVGSTERLDSAVGSLSTMFSGQAQAAAESGTGAWTQLKNAFMDFSEEVGKSLLPLMEPLKEKLEKITEKLSSLTKQQIATGIKFGLWIAAIGPALLVLSSLVTAISSIGGALMSTSKATIKLLGNLKKLGKWLVTNPYLALAGALFSIAAGFLISSVRANRFTNSLKGTTAPVKDITKRLKEINLELETTGKNNFQLIRDELLAKRDSIKEQIKLNEDLLNSEESLSDLAGEAGIFESMMRAQEATQKVKDLKFQLVEIDTTLKNTTKAEEDFNKGLNTTIIATDELGNSVASLGKSYGEWVGIDFNAGFEPIKTELINVSNLVDNLANIFANSFVDLFDRIKDSEGALLSFGEKFTQIGKQFLIDIGKMILKATLFAAATTLVSAAVGAPTLGFGSLIMAGLGISGMATGGSMTGGKPYLVGEHGAELVIPSGNANIQSASQTATMGIPDVRISGEDLIIVFDRAMRHRNTLG